MGDLIRWDTYHEEQYVPIKESLFGIVLSVNKWDAWEWWTISVLANTGQLVRLYPDYTKIEVMNELD